MRQVGRFHGGTKDSLIRSLIVHSMMAYWDVNGLTWTPHQALIERHVALSVPVRVDASTVRSVLGDLVRVGVLHRIRFGSRRVAYRLNRRFANPLQPGYAKEIDDLLREPVPWVDPLGTFVRAGLPNDPYPSRYVVPTFPHYFAQHAWMRAWIHALNMGIITHDPGWLPVVVRIARTIPVKVISMIGSLADHPLPSPWREAGRILRRTPLWERLQPGEAGSQKGGHGGWAARAAETVRNRGRNLRRVVSTSRRWLGDQPEEALALLHAFCGHDHVQHITRARTNRSSVIVPRLLGEDQVYHCLDQAAANLVLAALEGLDPQLRDKCLRFPGTGTIERQEPHDALTKPQRRDSSRASRHLWLTLDEFEDLVRHGIVSREAVKELVRYRRAWPRELYSPAW